MPCHTIRSTRRLHLIHDSLWTIPPISLAATPQTDSLPGYDPTFHHPTHALTTSFIPVLQNLAETNNAVPAVVNAAPKIQIPVKLFSLPKMAPAMGVPASTPKLMHANPMPILVPIRARFCVSETKMDGGSDTNVPEKKPSRRRKGLVLW